MWWLNCYSVRTTGRISLVVTFDTFLVSKTKITLWWQCNLLLLLMLTTRYLYSGFELENASGMLPCVTNTEEKHRHCLSHTIHKTIYLNNITKYNGPLPKNTHIYAYILYVFLKLSLSCHISLFKSFLVSVLRSRFQQVNPCWCGIILY